MKIDQAGKPKFHCGGTLISNKLIVTGKLIKI
jgi:hypothetical protein